MMDEQQPETAAPADTSASAPKPDTDIDRLLAEYDASVKTEPSAEPATADSNVGGDEIDRLLNSLGPDPRIADLEGKLGEASGQLDQFRREAFEKAEQAAFDKFAGDIKKQLPENSLPDDFVETQLLAMAAKDPALIAAFDMRHVDRAAVDAKLTQVEAAVAHLQRNPAADPALLNQLIAYGNKLGIALNSTAILSRAEREVIKRGKAFKPIDADATADRNLVAQSVRDAGGFVPDPPPRLGNLTDQEYRRYLKTLGIMGF